MNYGMIPFEMEKILNNAMLFKILNDVTLYMLLEAKN